MEVEEDRRDRRDMLVATPYIFAHNFFELFSLKYYFLLKLEYFTP